MTIRDMKASTATQPAHQAQPLEVDRIQSELDRMHRFFCAAGNQLNKGGTRETCANFLYGWAATRMALDLMLKITDGSAARPLRVLKAQLVDWQLRRAGIEAWDHVRAYQVTGKSLAEDRSPKDTTIFVCQLNENGSPVFTGQRLEYRTSSVGLERDWRKTKIHRELGRTLQLLQCGSYVITQPLDGTTIVEHSLPTGCITAWRRPSLSQIVRQTLNVAHRVNA